MKKYFLLNIGIILMLIFFSCKKEPSAPPTQPVPVDTSTLRSFRISLKDLPDPPDVITNLKAIITIRNSQNEIVLSKKTVNVAYNQQYITDTIQLKKGTYSITALLVQQGDTAIKFASPVAGSMKAALVTKPLSIPIELNEKTEKKFPVEVLPVSRTDSPEMFGYPAGSFGDRPNDPPGDPETPADKNIYLRPLIKIGNIVYDSVPVQLVLRSWDNKNNMTYKALSLPAGLQAIRLPGNGVRYQLSIAKWETYDELNLTKEQVQENTVYVMGGYKEAKKLKTVFEYKLVNGVSTPQSKTDYEYEANGHLKNRLIWGKRADMSNYLVRKDMFGYQNSRISQISGYDESNALITTTTFGYNNEGRVINMQELSAGQEINGTVNYLPLEGSSGISHNYRIDIQYRNTSQYYTTFYSKDIHGGNVQADIITTSHGNKETGLYAYDFAINPFAHLAIPDLYLSTVSKHNKTAQTKTWMGAYPEFEPYHYSYTYDQDGYPKELLTKYRSYQTKAEVFTIRTVFVY
jgi:hypothetical protein